MIKEEWKRLEDFPHRISNLGRIKTRGFPSIMLTPIPEYTKQGHLYIILIKDNKTYKKYIHDLVMKYFGSKRPSKKHKPIHIDGVLYNNWIENLEWSDDPKCAEHVFEIGE